MELKKIINRSSRKMYTKIPIENGIPIRDRNNLKVVIKTLKDDDYFFYIPDVIAWYLLLHKGWRLRDNYRTEDEFNEGRSKYNHIQTDKVYPTLCDEKSSFPYRLTTTSDDYFDRTHPDLIEAFEYWRPYGFKITDISNKEYWYIDHTEDRNGLKYEVLYTR